MEFLDLFSGIGGFRRGLERSGHKCIGHVEIDKYANKSYMAMYGLSHCKYGQCDKDNCCKICKTEVMETNVKASGSQKILSKSEQERFQKLKSGLLDFLAQTFPCQESGQVLKESEVDFFLQSLACSKAQIPKINPASLSLRMLSICCQAREAGILPPFSLTYGKQGMMLNGSVSTQKISECHSTENECTLLDILEESVDEKYFLSADQTERLLKKL